jgi:hypothetical protein
MVDTMPARATPAAAVESALIVGDLSKLTEGQRLEYYRQVCASLGLNPLTRPLEYISLKGRLTLYARKDCTDQLRQLRGVSIEKPDVTFQDDWIIVTVAARLPDGRTDSDLGVVSRKDMGGDFGNSLMKAITKAKRRVTLSICGLGLLDETEVETIPEAKHVAPVNLTALADPESRRVDLLAGLKEIGSRSKNGWQGLLDWWPTQYAGTPETADVATLGAAYELLTKK